MNNTEDLIYLFDDDYRCRLIIPLARGMSSTKLNLRDFELYHHREHREDCPTMRKNLWLDAVPFVYTDLAHNLAWFFNIPNHS